MGGAALIKFTGGFDLLLTVQDGVDIFLYFLYIIRSHSDPPSSQFSSDFGITLGFDFDSFGIILVHRVRSCNLYLCFIEFGMDWDISVDGLLIHFPFAH